MFCTAASCSTSRSTGFFICCSVRSNASIGASAGSGSSDGRRPDVLGVRALAVRRGVDPAHVHVARVDVHELLLRVVADADVAEVLPHPIGDDLRLDARHVDVHRAAEEMLRVRRAVGAGAIAGDDVDAGDVEVLRDGADDLDRARAHRLLAAGAPAANEVREVLHDVGLRVAVLVEERERRFFVAVLEVERERRTLVELVGDEHMRQVRHVRNQGQSAIERSGIMASSPRALAMARAGSVPNLQQPRQALQ